MRAIMPSVPPDILEWRKRTGADRWDEMWEGVLHMGPTPSWDHQDLEFAMEAFLRRRWGKPKGAKVIHNINVASPGGWPHDYRIPDLVLLTPERFGINFNEYLEGAPEVVVEIRSPGDETYEKIPFYLKLGVPEVWIVDRDTKEPEVLALVAGQYQKRSPGVDGWILSERTGLELRRGKPGRLEMRLQGDGVTSEEMP